MSKHTDINRFMCSSYKQAAEFYQHLLKGIWSYEELGTRVIKRIRTAYSFRQVERVRELSGVLLQSPIGEHRLIGQFYIVWCELRESKCNDKILDSVIEQTTTYKSKALISKGTLELHRGTTETALYSYTEALAARPTASEYIVASRGIALAKSMEGFHASALRDLERLIPLLKHAEPITYYDVLNSYAVELIEANRLSEAERVSLSVVSSRFAPYYPEWRETREEIERRGWCAPRSVVAFTQSTRQTNNLVRLPLPELSDSLPLQSPPASQPARVLSLQEWKERMPKKPNGDQDKTPPRPTTAEEKSARLKELEKLTTREKLLMVMNVIGDERVGDDLLLKALIILEGLEPDENQG